MSKFCSQCGHRLAEDARFCSECGTPVKVQVPENTESAVPSGSKAAAAENTAYDVFLSYSHKDRDEFGMEYILRIKDEIEKALAPIITDHQPRVFLDAEALHLGDHWHSKIMESLNQCKAIVCLVSEAYLKSEYCTRERLWWNARQTRDGHFLDAPYPVYFVKLEKGLFSERREVKEMMAVQTDSMPWFEVKQKLQEDFIRERLAGISTAVCDKVRAAERAKESFCSVLPPLYENFVGRVTELRELHELCVNGKYPVIQAFGGVGKTELSVAYAYGFADQYPMGRFLFRMERVTSWDEAFAKALDMDGTDAQGVSKKVLEELGIKKEDLEGKKQGEQHKIAAKAFLERAAKGKLLILLDNLDEDTALLKKMRDFLCGNPIPANIHILATTRGSFRFSDQERFKSYELKNLKEDEAFEMVCLTGNGQYPFDRQPPSAENKEYQAAHKVIRFLDGHAWSMEIVSAFMADNYDPEGFTFAMELESLQKNGLLSSETGATYRAGDSSATSAELLRPTLDKLATLELGAETLELAVFAACFDPDEIPIYLLTEYWDRNFFNVTCSKGAVPFVYAVNLLAKYHLIHKDKEFCKMHRLMQSVFLSHKEKYLSHIIETLPKCPFVPAKYWIPLLLQTPELADICPQDGTLKTDVWIKLLANPVFLAMCPLQSFSGEDWARLLSIQPQFANRCDWNKLDGREWRMLLGEQPQFADQCDWSKLDGWDWTMLLSKQPQFADKCDWNKLNGRKWECLLEEQPQFAEKCDWNNLNGREWADLLEKQPQFADKCDWGLLNMADGEDWADLLSKQPQFADKCDWSRLDGGDWASLLGEQPQFADKCDWRKLGRWNWSWLLCFRPQFASKCDWSKLDGSDWANLLREQPQFASKCDWSKLDGREWANLLEEQPQFAEKCDWSKLNGREWANLLEKQPQFADKCDWRKLDGKDWAHLLSWQPQFADKCDLSKLNGKRLGKLLCDFPQLVKYCDLGKLDGEDWARLLARQPQFADKCDWDKLDEKDWASLLGEQPQFADKCDLSKLDGSDWITLLRGQPQFADKCDWSKLDGENWTDLLIELFAERGQPQFGNKCDWSKLDGENWSFVLADQPQFADKCDWDKLSEDDWENLLEYQPQFADKCDLSKLSEEERQMLLKKFPQLHFEKQ